MERKKSIYRLGLLVVSMVLIAVIIIGQDMSVNTLSQFGSRGDEVRKIQQILKNQGLYTGNVDGIYGTQTERAVIRYQQKYKLRVDGISGAETLKHMGIYQAPTSNDNNSNLLARAISAEARGESYDGQVAVGAVIMNRIRHPSFPNTIAGVIYQNGAFSSVADGQINLAPTQSAVKAAQDVLNGYDPSWGSIYFYNPKKTTNQWIKSRPVVRVIGDHVFCK